MTTSDKPESIYMSIPSDPKLMKVVRSAVAQICEMANLSHGQVNCVKLAVDEACTNTIRHSYKNDYNQRIYITFEIYGDRLQFIIKDYGKKIDLNSIKVEGSRKLKPGGLGVYIMREVMDEVDYDTSPKDGTRLKLVKYLNQEDKKDGSKQAQCR